MTRTIPELDWTKRETPNIDYSYLVQETLDKITLEDDSGYLLLESSLKNWVHRPISNLIWN